MAQVGENPSIKSGLGTQGQGFTCQASLGVPMVNEEGVLALGEQGQGSELEHLRHQSASQQQGPGPEEAEERMG